MTDCKLYLNDAEVEADWVFSENDLGKRLSIRNASSVGEIPDWSVCSLVYKGLFLVKNAILIGRGSDGSVLFQEVKVI